MKFLPLFCGILLFSAVTAMAKPIDTNEVSMPDAPDWLKASRVEQLTDHMGAELEWDIRKFNVKFYTSEAEFEKAHGFTSNVLAVTRGWENAMWIGPQVTDLPHNPGII